MPVATGVTTQPTQIGTGSSSSQTNASSTSSSGSYSGPTAYTAAQETGDYNNAVDFHAGNYANILQGYQNVLGSTQSNADRIGSGYSALNNSVQNQIAGTEASQRQAIADQYAQAQGASNYSAVNRGLGNSTVLDSLQRGNLADKTKQDIALSNQMAQLKAGYAGQFGSAGLAAQSAAAQQQATLGGQYMGVLGSQQAPRVNYAPNTTRSQSDSASTSQSLSNSIQASLTQPPPGISTGPNGTYFTNPGDATGGGALASLSSILGANHIPTAPAANTPYYNPGIVSYLASQHG